jgi:uncharacterized protein YbjT (DUF2867 family)
MILVTGATGTIGSEVVRQLAEKKAKVRAMTRDPAKAKMPAGVEIVAGDLEQPETLAKALKGVTKVFALASGPGLGKHDGNLARAAKAAGAKHVVKLSASSATDYPRQLIGQWHLAGEAAIKEVGVDWTFVRPGGFMSNALNWAPTIKAQGKIFAPTGDGKFAPIDPYDIAAVIVRALTSEGHAGKVYTLSGPELLSTADQAAIISEAIGKPVAHVPVPEAAARDGMTKAGMPPALVDAILQLMENIRNGKGGSVLPTVEQVTGRKARRFADWARDHRQAFI